MAKGQIEIIAILGIVIVIAVVGYFAVAGLGPAPAAPTGVQQEQLTVKDTMDNFIRSGVEDTLKTISLHGGYSSEGQFPLGSVELNGRSAPYWFYQGTKQVPALEGTLDQGLTAYINNNKAALQESLAGQDVVIGTPSVSTRVLSNQVIADVTLPVSVKGYAMGSSYSVSLPTRIGEIYEFSEKFTDFVSAERFFEHLTFYQMLVSPLDNDVQKVPVYVQLMDCGKFVYIDRYDVKPSMEDAITSTLAHTYMPGKYPTGVEYTAEYLRFTLPPLDGKEYSDLTVSFHTPDGFELDYDTFQMSPDPVSTVATPIPMTGSCVSEPVYVNYYVTYPAVVQVKDPLTGNLFRFAFQVFMKDNVPGDWAAGGYAMSEDTRLCLNGGCLARIAVTDSSGNPVPYAHIRFSGCGYRAGADGVFEGPIPCGMGTLNIRDDRYGIYEKASSSGVLADAHITLYQQPLVNMHFHEVSIQNSSMYYIIDPEGVKWINNDIRPEEAVTVTFISKEDGEKREGYFDSTSGNIRLPPGDYFISASLAKRDYSVFYGGFGDELTVTEETKSLHLYIPYMEGFSLIKDNETAINAGITMTNVLKKCSMGPVSDTIQALEKPCYVAYGDL